MFNKAEIEDLPIHPATESEQPSVLEGLKVIDFSHFLAGPVATMLMADFGANILKIEPPGKGEDFRYYPPHDPDMPAQGGAYLWANRNKRSVALDLKTPEGLMVVRELIAQADVLIENFSTGVMQRYGLGYEECAAHNPRLIYCSVSAYGREGPFADRLGFDPVAQAESGFMSMNGYPDRPGVRTGASVMDISTGMMAANAILLALLARERSGKGQYLEVALFDTAMFMTGFATMQHLLTGNDGGRYGNTSPDTCPSGVFMASDQGFYINCGNDKIFQRLMIDVLNLPAVAFDPQYARGVDRVARREALFAVLEEEFAKQPWSYWQSRMRAAAVPHGEVRTLRQALCSPQVRTRGLVSRIPHPVKGWIPNLASPIRLSQEPVVAPRAAPAVGQHTEEVLRDVLGYDEAQMANLRATGALGGQKKTVATPTSSVILGKVAVQPIKENSPSQGTSAYS
jgi:crotonobetainyl-CoA:carnitine CoA-transferase CaiB-like acyl-CoA transferase